jgi:predicted aspartyl protease
MSLIANRRNKFVLRFQQSLLALAILTIGVESSHPHPSLAGQPKMGTTMPGDDSANWLPFSIPDGRHIVMSASINGIDSELMIDSGASDFALSSSFATQLGLVTTGHVIASGVTGRSMGRVVQSPLISIGGITIRPAVTNVFDFEQLSALAGRPITAVIGRDLFRRFVVDIDFGNSRIAFHSGRIAERALMAHQLSLLQQGHGNRSIPISIGGREPIQAIFDLGSDTALYLSPDYAKRQELLHGKRQSTSLSAGVEGTEQNTVAVLDQIDLAGSVLKNVPVEIPQRWANPVPAVVGLPILQRFRLVIDFSDGHVSFIPNERTIDLPFRKDRSGIGAQRLGNSLRVVFVVPGSPAEAAGLKRGDTIISINGKPLDDEYFKARPHEGSKQSGTLLRLTLGNGSIIELRLADYY